MTATISGTNGDVSVVFSAPASAGAPNSIVIVSGDGQSATAGSALPLAIVVKVLDQHANPVPNATVSCAASGTLASPVTTTDVNGIASDSLVLGVTAGADAITLFTPGANQTVTAAVNETAN